MSLHDVTPGARAPDEFNVIIEIPMNADPIKYEVDKATGALFVDRFMSTPFPLFPGVVVTCRPIGMLKMSDEAGGDAKLLAVPIDKILPIYQHWQKPEDMNDLRLQQITHFFEHYKDLEPGKWVKVEGWEGPESARTEIRESIKSYRNRAKTS
jgi:inorganic pyrophosphatase